MPRLGREATHEELLYDAQWTKDVDNMFIDLLAEAHVAGNGDRQVSTHVFLYCHGVLVADVGATFIMIELQEHFDFLHKWFLVFSWMLRKHGLRHCNQSNVLTTPVAVWNDIFELEPFSVAYQHSRDPSWADIQYLFTEVYEATSDAPSYVFSLSSLTNTPLNGSSQKMPESVTLLRKIPRHGGGTPLRIPRPPRKPAPLSCKRAGRTGVRLNPLSLSLPEPAFESWLHDSDYLEVLDQCTTSPP
ncbi:prenylated RAB acceptor 1.H, partial [Striga asiatica]